MTITRWDGWQQAEVRHVYDCESIPYLFRGAGGSRTIGWAHEHASTGDPDMLTRYRVLKQRAIRQRRVA